ncbi:MAG: RDD family protein [Planctomycetes bacterium]|nr:RDD family protein [Planctomycetota bacterium]
MALGCFLPMPTVNAQEAAWGPARVWVSGSKEQVFVVATNAAKPGDMTAELRFWWAGTKAAASNQLPGTSAYLEPIQGDIVELGTDRDGLKLLAPDGTVYGYSASSLEPVVASWKHLATEPPLAWAGDDSQPVVFAVVQTSSLIGPTTTSSDAANANDTEASQDGIASWLVPTKGSSAAPTTKYTLLALRRGVWQRHAFFREADEADTFWIAGRNEHAFLFWRAEDRSIRFAEYAAGNWSGVETVTSRGDIVRAWAGSTSDGPIFIGGSGPDVRSLRLNLVARDATGAWVETGAVREGSDYLTLDGINSGVGMALGRLAVARPGEKGQVEFAWGDATGSPVLRFAPLTARLESAPRQQSWRDMLLPAVVLSVMTVLLLSRRDHVLRPAAVPSGLMIAPVWKRGFAAILDMIPAALVGSMTLMLLRTEFGLSEDPSQLLEQVQTDSAIQEKLIPVYLLQILVYGLWCMIWELTTGTTLGKRIFGCRVISLDGSPTQGRQIVLRNVVRIVMVSLGAPGLLITFLTMIVLTRNSQRMGDVLARTIVVQAGPPGPIPVARPRNDHNGEPPTKD